MDGWQPQRPSAIAERNAYFGKTNGALMINVHAMDTQTMVVIRANHADGTEMTPELIERIVRFISIPMETTICTVFSNTSSTKSVAEP